MPKLPSKINSILVIGDVMLDKYWHSSSRVLSEEAPVATVVVDQTDYRAGGAANVAINIRMLARETTDVAILAPLGQDKNGAILNGLIDNLNIRTYWQYGNSTTTITKHRILSNNQQVVRVDFEQPYQPIILEQNIKQIIAEHKVIVLSDYNKGTLGLVSEIIKYARSLNKIILVDPKGHDFSKYKGATLLTPNHKEYTDIVGFNDLDNNAYRLIEELELDCLLVTLGARGMTLYHKELHQYHACSYAEQVYDVTGAGDTVIASLAVSLAEDTDKIKAIEYASYAAALVVSQIGTGHATRLAVKQLMTQRDFNKTKRLKQENKLLVINSLEMLNVVFNNGRAFENILLFYWDYDKDNILTANNLAHLIKIHSKYQLQPLWVVISNNLTLAKADHAHSVEELAYCLGEISIVGKVIFSPNIDIKLHLQITQGHEIKLEQEFL